MDHVNVYRFDVEKGKVKAEDIIRSEMESAPVISRFPRMAGIFTFSMN